MCDVVLGAEFTILDLDCKISYLFCAFNVLGMSGFCAAGFYGSVKKSGNGYAVPTFYFAMSGRQIPRCLSGRICFTPPVSN